MKDFRKLTVWQRAHQLTLAAYRATVSFPRAEVYGLTSQIRRAASSIGANIAEGCGRGSDADFNRFLSMAMGSASELDYHLLPARDLEMLSADKHKELSALVGEVKRMLASLINKLKADPRSTSASRVRTLPP
jgi:four helix bundle protein